MRIHPLIIAGCAIGLAACGSGEKDAPKNLPSTKGALQGVVASAVLASGLTDDKRPSAVLGIYVSAYLSQGMFLPVRSAIIGINAGRSLISGQGGATDETFTLLQELGNILQVDVEDILNRSTERRKALDEYLQSIRNIFVLSERKISELSTTVQSLEEEEREKRKAAQVIQREIEKAMENEDYTAVGSRQRDLSDAESTLAVITSKREQTSDIESRFSELLDIAKERIIAIESNRVILIAGLKVIKLPGIEDLHILLEKGRFQRNASKNALGTDNFQ